MPAIGGGLPPFTLLAIDRKTVERIARRAVEPALQRIPAAVEVVFRPRAVDGQPAVDHEPVVAFEPERELRLALGDEEDAGEMAAAFFVEPVEILPGTGRAATRGRPPGKTPASGAMPRDRADHDRAP